MWVWSVTNVWTSTKVPENESASNVWAKYISTGLSTHL